MTFDPTLAAIRFGLGLSPVVATPTSAAQMIDLVAGPDTGAALVPPLPGEQAGPSLQDLIRLTQARNQARGTDAYEPALDAYNAARRVARDAAFEAFKRMLARGTVTPDGFRERLVRFWADHFTVVGKNGNSRHLVGPYVEEAIRPHVAGRFVDMLRAVVSHPMMLFYLDQRNSIGPESPAGLRTERGLNENLAREMLELHTVGVAGSYTQTDVRELAELLTGLTWHIDRGTEYRANWAEPGAETVLGRTFSAEASMALIDDALDWLARHPDTARHIATKIAVHFVSDTPDPDLVEALAQTWLATDGAFLSLYDTLLAHPAAWAPARAKVKQPIGYIQSALRALAPPVDTLMAVEFGPGRRFLTQPLTAMGQPWEVPGGPDGWPEAAEAWVTPQSMAARITWAFEAPRRLTDTLPDPRDFVLTALGEGADPDVVFAASAAEDIAEGIGVVLASAAFQRR